MEWVGADALTVGQPKLKRMLTRRLQSVLGKSSMSYFQSQRVQRAVHLLKTAHANIEEVAAKVGYKDGGTLRFLLRRPAQSRIKRDKKTS